MKENVIGILGGMGPEATADLFMRIIKTTPATKDQDHLRVIIDNNPKIPDRTAGILGTGPNPLPEMTKTAQNVEKAGADFIIIPCNTAHYYHNKLQASVRIPILNMVELTAKTIVEDFHAKKVGLLCTTGTIKAGIYDRAFGNEEIEVMYPPAELQKDVMKAIYGIKSGQLLKAKKLILEVAAYHVDKGADIIICGCTEVSLVLKEGDIPISVVDPLQILAETAVKQVLRRNTYT